MGHTPAIDVNELLAMLDVPEIEKNLHFAMEGYKVGNYGALFRHRETQKATFKQAVFDSVRPKGENQGQEMGKPSVLYWFELIQFSGKWKMMVLEPTPPPYFDIHEIMPLDIIQQIVSDLPDPEKIQLLTQCPSELYGKSFDLQFIQFSAYHVAGTVQENSLSWQERQNKQLLTGNEELEATYRALFHSMEKYPRIRAHLFREFFDFMRPYIKNKNA